MKGEFIGSMQEMEVSEIEKLDERAIPVIEDYEKTMRCKKKKKGIINVAFRQGRIFKRFKDLEGLEDMLKELRLKIFKLLKKIPKAKEINLNFLKNYLKAIKEEFKENKMNFSYNFIN